VLAACAPWGSAARHCERNRAPGAARRVIGLEATLLHHTRVGYHASMVGYAMQKDDLVRRLRRIEGQVRGLQQMVEEDRYCIDVLTQISAATKALQSVAIGMFDDHLRHCVADAVAGGGEDAEVKLTEATAAVERLVKS
jgi:DNA-binding FrmR family transcriptional regulator